jgi:hypothetical protein
MIRLFLRYRSVFELVSRGRLIGGVVCTLAERIRTNSSLPVYCLIPFFLPSTRRLS